MQVHLRRIVGLVADRHNKASIAIKRVVILLLMKALAFKFVKPATSVKCNIIKRGMPVCPTQLLKVTTHVCPISTKDLQPVSQE